MPGFGFFSECLVLRSESAGIRMALPAGSKEIGTPGDG
jgi:hypothetical protein